MLTWNLLFYLSPVVFVYVYDEFLNDLEYPIGYFLGQAMLL